MKNSLYPFFWQHGEDHQVLETYMEKISESGMGGVCIEARPHPEFVKEGWWNDLDCIINKAKELSMKLWILDDSHFPTGYANGKVKEAYPQYLKLYLDMRRYDIHGPLKKARIDLSLLKGRPWDKPDFSEEILGVYMAERMSPWQSDGDQIDMESMINVTDCIDPKTRLLTVDIKEGAYSIFVVYETRKGGEESTKDYLNPLVKEATQVLIDEVYEPHYKHYKEEFGKTIQGFFSDEPRFGNTKGTEASIGRMDMVLPWRKGLQKEIGFDERFLPLLWANANGKEKEIRFQYMDRITELYHENFTKVLADWCKDHGVWYLGHNIEDNGAHARLGYGTGHYFRGQQEMDFAGIDVIGGQIVPGMNYHHDAFSTGGSNGEFYHYALAKLASSAAHLDPVKKGRAMCEAFGAYGWNEGLKTMKWIADHLMVRGINYLVPHAFNPKSFPDFDCPPHFYVHGHNPQFRYFKYFSDYVNRVMDIMKDGHYPAKIGLLYPAEMEWAGDYMPVEKPARVLTQSQIPFDIVTRDYLKQAEITDGKYKINQTEFEVLVVPYGEYMPEDLKEVIEKFAKHDIRIIFVDDEKDYAESVELKQLGKYLKDYQSLVIEGEEPELVIGEYEKNDTKYWMFFNENISKEFHIEIEIKEPQLYQYDAYRNVITKLEIVDQKAVLNLAPYETVIWMTKPYEESKEMEYNALYEFSKKKEWDKKEIKQEWSVSYADSFSYPEFEQEVPINHAKTVQEMEGWEKASGTLRYETIVKMPVNGKTVLEIENAYETVEVFVNGRSAGVRLSKPYRFDLSEFLEDGKNKLAIEVTNTLGTTIRDAISHYLPIEPFGIDGEIVLYQKQEEKK